MVFNIAQSSIKGLNDVSFHLILRNTGHDFICNLTTRRSEANYSRQPQQTPTLRSKRAKSLNGNARELNESL